MCNFRDFIEQRGIEQGLLQGKAEGKVEEGNVEATFLHVKKLVQRINVSAMDAMNILDVENDIHLRFCSPYIYPEKL